jgi:hypothetical protein
LYTPDKEQKTGLYDAGKSGPAGPCYDIRWEVIQQNLVTKTADQRLYYISTKRRKKEEEKILVMGSVGGPCATHLLAKRKKKKKVLARGDKRGGTEWIRRGNRNIKKTSASDCMAGLLSLYF